MKVRICNPANAAGLQDPDSKRSPFLDPATGDLIPEVEVPATNYWVRRVRDGEIERIDQPAPLGNEPLAPLTTRSGKR